MRLSLGPAEQVPEQLPGASPVNRKLTPEGENRSGDFKFWGVITDQSVQVGVGAGLETSDAFAVEKRPRALPGASSQRLGPGTGCDSLISIPGLIFT